MSTPSHPSHTNWSDVDSSFLRHAVVEDSVTASETTSPAKEAAGEQQEVVSKRQLDAEIMESAMRDCSQNNLVCPDSYDDVGECSQNNLVIPDSYDAGSDVEGDVPDPASANSAANDNNLDPAVESMLRILLPRYFNIPRR